MEEGGRSGANNWTASRSYVAPSSAVPARSKTMAEKPAADKMSGPSRTVTRLSVTTPTCSAPSGSKNRPNFIRPHTAVAAHR